MMMKRSTYILIAFALFMVSTTFAFGEDKTKLFTDTFSGATVITNLLRGGILWIQGLALLTAGGALVIGIIMHQNKGEVPWRTILTIMGMAGLIAIALEAINQLVEVMGGGS